VASACELYQRGSGNSDSRRFYKKAMMERLRREYELSEMFTAYLPGRNILYEEDLVDQLFNSGEKRLARS